MAVYSRAAAIEDCSISVKDMFVSTEPTEVGGNAGVASVVAKLTAEAHVVMKKVRQFCTGGAGEEKLAVASLGKTSLAETVLWSWCEAHGFMSMAEWGMDKNRLGNSFHHAVETLTKNLKKIETSTTANRLYKRHFKDCAGQEESVPALEWAAHRWDSLQRPLLGGTLPCGSVE